MKDDAGIVPGADTQSHWLWAHAHSMIPREGGGMWTLLVLIPMWCVRLADYIGNLLRGSEPEKYLLLHGLKFLLIPEGL